MRTRLLWGGIHSSGSQRGQCESITAVDEGEESWGEGGDVGVRLSWREIMNVTCQRTHRVHKGSDRGTTPRTRRKVWKRLLMCRREPF